MLPDIPDIAGITTETISGIINCRAACLCFDEKGQPERNFIQQQSIGKQVRRKVDNASEIKHRIEGLRIAYDAGESFTIGRSMAGRPYLALCGYPRKQQFL
jgi:two-component system sensor histidine kinase KdpD